MILEAAKSILQGYTRENPLPLQRLIEAIRTRLGVDAPSGTEIYSELLEASRNSESGIGSKKGKGGGYFLTFQYSSTSFAIEISSGEGAEIMQTSEEKAHERHLWPLVAAWLSAEKRFSHVRHDLAHLKAGGIWSNPDVIALSPIDDIGFFDIEIMTAEVKPTLKNWKYFFFEAVSHKRFSERCYYVARNDARSSDEEIRELAGYAEKYGVGLVLIEMDQETFEKLPSMNPDELIACLQLFEEYIPAPFAPVSLREKIGFLKRVGVNARQDLYRWGR